MQAPERKFLATDFWTILFVPSAIFKIPSRYRPVSFCADSRLQITAFLTRDFSIKRPGTFWFLYVRFLTSWSITNHFSPAMPTLFVAAAFSNVAPHTLSVFDDALFFHACRFLSRWTFLDQINFYIQIKIIFKIFDDQHFYHDFSPEPEDFCVPTIFRDFSQFLAVFGSFSHFWHFWHF